jgi:superfamily II DNA or RNA helicase
LRASLKGLDSEKGDFGGFRGREWSYSYKTSTAGPDGRPVDILHDFYIPVLKRAVRYDRMAGYFRSSSLAVASQGFSAFAASGGEMRLVVGADLDGADVEAILSGDATRLERLLTEALGEPEAWPEEVRNGVELLCWMVAHGHLEVRVAFRVHKDTGKPLAFSATDDGYVHEKWAVLTDAEGNRLYVSGSLNESKTALSLNAENIDVHADWWAEIEKRRTDDARAAFESVWKDKSPHLRVLTLPEALRQRLISIGKSVSRPTEIDGSSAFVSEVEPPSALERLRFAIIRHGPRLPWGRYVGMETAPVEPWPHQEVVARRLIETWPYSYLLCDEVGLGKTIEAGLAIRSLVLSGLARRVLIVPPASLTRQWHREMATKFFLPFARALTGQAVRHEYIFPISESAASDNLYRPDLCIVSTGLLSRRERSEDLRRSEPFDIALVDEAHYARRKNPTERDNCRSLPRFGKLYHTMRDYLRTRSRCLWMATATPMQMDWIEVFDLLQLTDRVGQFQNDPTITKLYYETLGELVRGQGIDANRWGFLRKAISSTDRLDPFLKRYFDEAVIDGPMRSAAIQWLERGRVPRGVDLRHVVKLIFSAAPLSRVMLRHTRPLLEIYEKEGKLTANLAKREILPIPNIGFTPIEKRAYDELEDYCRGLTAKIGELGANQKTSNSLGFLLSFLRLRFASSLFAIRETLKRRLERVEATLEHQQQLEEPDLAGTGAEELEDEESDREAVQTLLKNRTQDDLEWERRRLADMIVNLEDLSETPSKMKVMLGVLDNRRIAGRRIRQTVIFTRFYDTLTDLVRRLRQIDSSMLIGTYSGQGGQYVDPAKKRFVGVERDKIKHRFLRGEIDVLVCTDAAAEGLNLQTADLIINFDLPWNPMKVEQRVGRIDRIGQKHERISVLNLCYVGSVEEKVYGRLLRRFAQTGHIVGSQQISMLPVTEEDFLKLAEGELTETQLETMARHRIAIQRQRTASMEIPPGDLYKIYVRMGQRREILRPPVSLQAIWQSLGESRYLRDVGCTLEEDPERPVLAVRGMEGIPDKTLFTVDRALYEKGLPDAEGNLHFATYGNPFFERLLDIFGEYELPGCLRLIEEKIPDMRTGVAAFAVACRGEGGVKQVKLITSWTDLEGMDIDEETELADSELEPLKRQLHELVREEFSPTRTVPRLEDANQRAAGAQEVFNLLAAKSMLFSVEGTGLDNFWSVVREMDIRFQETGTVRLDVMPVAGLRAIHEELLLDVRPPAVGEMTGVTIPSFFAQAGVDAACRLAESMRIRKSELTVNTVRSRLEREVGKKLAALDVLRI